MANSNNQKDWGEGMNRRHRIGAIGLVVAILAVVGVAVFCIVKATEWL